MLVSQILKEKDIEGVLTVAPGTSVSEAAQILSERRIGALIIAEDGASPLGIITERDIVRELGKRGGGCLGDAVDDLMTREIISCVPGDRALRVLQLMTEGRFRHMPVMDGDKLIGMVSIGDVVKGRLQELAAQNESLKAMIMGY
ncbi:CBS domain-containing protein [Maritimibacter sp. HL-12]|jgi:CBS domain-containing protein|uniref:CBS domain-containing protein n=1 Tax=Maritimibacter sp. HL-12 TaxID=1162418 RepID=UPI000A0F2098|nr:CBS domain-containing protein [Maritimibacter sp. HL-12]SMH58333.1 Predicted signal-transduction protein containing cAMP-binding and CBS domains [Maritimibacter sp. HL-12]